ncbi:response regulator [Lunatibacter salilacus]|uniref:response regulator n=1 Tax=Lunatibacter salilacus TaxID=2483804 RepID=UPI00131AF21F|nr:response regulator [Lunatibacter salilacus]
MPEIKIACVVDDDPLYNFGIKKLFEYSSFSEDNLFYKNGQEAIDGLSKIIENGETLPNVILLDINMPIMNGWQFLEEFKNRGMDIHGIRIFVVSSSINQDEIDRANAYDYVSGYIFKPLTMDKIKDLKEKLANM